MEEIHFFKCRTDDLIAYYTESENEVTLRRPIVVYIDTDMDEQKQFLAIKEYLPGLFCSTESMTLKKDEITFHCPLNMDFVDDYIKISDFFYGELVAQRRSLKKTKESGNVIDFTGTKRNPVH